MISTLETQAKLLEEMQDKGFNIVNCGQCGDVFIHRTKQNEINCPHCNFNGEPCDFPDLFY